MWSRKYDKCINCGKNDTLHASRGVCQRCYQREYQREYARQHKELMCMRQRRYIEKQRLAPKKEDLIRQQYILEGRRWLINITNRISQMGVRIEDVARAIKMDKGRLKLMVNQDIMVKPRYQQRIADYFGVPPEEIFSVDKK